MLKERVHNEFEAQVLLKESHNKGENKYDSTRFYTHDGDYLFTSFVTPSGFVLNIVGDNSFKLLKTVDYYR